MHDSVLEWVQTKVFDLQLADLTTLEVGSFDVNGTVRPFFTGPYTGIDHADGPGVDRVMDAMALQFEDETFEVVVSTEMLEHCEKPWVAVSEMARVLVPGGNLLLTARGFDERGAFGYHNPPDEYRFGRGAMEGLAEYANLRVLDLVADPQVPGWFLAATK